MLPPLPLDKAAYRHQRKTIELFLIGFIFIASGLEEEVGVKEGSKVLSVSRTGGQSGQRPPEVPTACTQHPSSGSQ